MRVTPLLLSLVVLMTVGCGHGLNKRSARQAFSAELDSATKKQRPFTEVTFYAGDFDSTAWLGKYDCENGAFAPLGIDDARKYKDFGLLTLKKLGPCHWKGDLIPPFDKDVSYRGDIGKDGSVYTSLATSRLSSYEIVSASSEGEHGEAKIKLIAAFTPTMKELVKHNEFPDIDEKACEYDIPANAVVCTHTFPMMYVDKAWKVDPAKLKQQFDAEKQKANK